MAEKQNDSPPEIGILTQAVKVQSTGMVRGKGEGIMESEVPPRLWAAWVEEGIVSLAPPPDLMKTRQRKAATRKRAASRKVL